MKAVAVLLLLTIANVSGLCYLTGDDCSICFKVFAATCKAEPAANTEDQAACAAVEELGASTDCDTAGCAYTAKAMTMEACPVGIELTFVEKPLPEIFEGLSADSCLLCILACGAGHDNNQSMPLACDAGHTTQFEQPPLH